MSKDNLGRKPSLGFEGRLSPIYEPVGTRLLRYTWLELLYEEPVSVASVRREANKALRTNVEPWFSRNFVLKSRGSVGRIEFLACALPYPQNIYELVSRIPRTEPRTLPTYLQSQTSLKLTDSATTAMA